MQKILTLLPFAAIPLLRMLPPDGLPSDENDKLVHEAMEAMETHLEALAEASISALTADADDDLSGFTKEAQTALDGLAKELQPILLTTPPALKAKGDQPAADTRKLHERELTYQRDLIANLDKVLEAEQALVGGDWDALQKCIDQLYEQEESSHARFRVRQW